MSKIYLAIAALMISAFNLSAQDVELNHITSVNEGAGEGYAEVIAYYPAGKKAYFTSSEKNNFFIVDIADVQKPEVITEIDLSPYGGGPNSIDISKDGLVAVAIENENKQDNGVVAFFDSDGNFSHQIEVGALPDMLTFNADGDKLFVANEGEPSKDYSNDPEGTVSIIDVASKTETRIDFTAYNDKKASLINKGVRIFGPNATVAQDIEPEYITIAPNGYLYVACQENNALAVINVEEAKVMDILPLGVKDHSVGQPMVKNIILNKEADRWPVLGVPQYGGGQPAVKLGGFSGLWVEEGPTEDEKYIYCVPDRGPNGSTIKKANVSPATSQNLRPFKLPRYQGCMVKMLVNIKTGETTFMGGTLFTAKDGVTPITGKGNIPGYDEVPVVYPHQTQNFDYTQVDYTDANGVEYHELEYDPLGGDFEGILRDKNGDFWLCDEYRPAIYKFTPEGVLIERFVAKGTSMLGDTPQAEGFYGKETLPEVYSKRRANRGFEAIAYDEEKGMIYAFIQSPMYNPDSSTKNKSDVIRILGIDMNGEPKEEYVYLLERNKDAGLSASRVDKIGDAYCYESGKFMVIERDSEGPEETEGKKYIYKVDLSKSTNILGKTFDKELETMTADEIVAAGVVPAYKIKAYNLPSIGYVSSDKPEGISYDGKNIYVMNDNDFGLAGAGITDDCVLGVITLGDNNSFDASNKDGNINFQNWNTLGMFMPDAISSYEANGKTYIVTANEGDSRDYDGYSEETRVAKLDLDPSYFPDAASLQDNANLGRLKTTTANGDIDGDGKMEYIYSYGGRSFSIFDQYGNLVYDSANEFGKTIADKEAELFNEDDGELDGRSDDKGGEPEAVAIGTVDGYTFAFIGLERQSAVMVYNITDPINPSFVTYYSTRTVGTDGIKGDVSPEVIKFLSAEDSPNGKEMLLIGYEVSGTMGIVQIGDIVTKLHDIEKAKLSVYPNPAENRIRFNKNATGTVTTTDGNVIMEFNDTRNVDISNLKTGVYIINTNLGARKIMKL